MPNFEKLFTSLRFWLLGKGYFTAVKALEFSRHYHSGIRKDGHTPEFEHQLRIALYIRTLPDLLHPEETISVALLHDVDEDYKVGITTIQGNFGIQIAASTDLMNKKRRDTSLSEKEYFYALQGDPRSSIVKGADRMHNQQTMGGVFTPEKQRAYITETTTFILPMLKMARRNFPEQEPAYQNIKHMLVSQMEFIEAFLASQEPTEKLLSKASP